MLDANMKRFVREIAENYFPELWTEGFARDVRVIVR
jgi:hypothetical protein